MLGRLHAWYPESRYVRTSSTHFGGMGNGEIMGCGVIQVCGLPVGDCASGVMGWLLGALSPLADYWQGASDLRQAMFC